LHFESLASFERRQVGDGQSQHNKDDVKGDVQIREEGRAVEHVVDSRATAPADEHGDACEI
jgi:hypothetical protein